MLYSWEFLRDCNKIADSINTHDINAIVVVLKWLRGRLFIIGSGGGAGHASHAVCDFRKICGIEAYAPYDNISELTARTNDEGYEKTISQWLGVSNFNKDDCLMVFSVGGGAPGVSENINNALKMAKETGAKIVGIVGPNGGNTKILSDACVIIPAEDNITPLVEGWQSLICHLIVSHPELKKNNCIW